MTRVKFFTINSLRVAGFELMLARRLGWKAEGRKRTSPAVGVAVAGVALAMVVMLLSVAVMTGFKREVTARVMGMHDAITIRSYTPEGLSRTFRPEELTAMLPEGVTAVPHTQAEGILKTDSDFMGVIFSAVPTLTADSVINISARLADKLGLSEGDRVPAYFVVDERMKTRMLRVGRVTANTGIAKQDESVVQCSAGLPAGLLGLAEGEVQSLGITGIGREEIAPVAEAIREAMLRAYYSGELTGGAYAVETLLQTDGQVFSWLDVLDTNVVVILVLMGLVAAFTIISSCFIIILERVRTIGVLKAMGASNAQVRRVFMLMAERLVLRGLLVGNVVGLALIAVQYFTHLIPMNPEDYFVDFVPVRLSVVSLVAVNVGALALSWMVLLLPAMLTARISPAVTMRYE